MTNLNANVDANEFLTLVDHAAGMNDRWLFLAAFCMLLIGGGIVIYWLVRHLQAVIDDHKKLREAHHDALAEMIDQQNETSLKLAVCLDRNTAALQECNFELRCFRERK